MYRKEKNEKDVRYILDHLRSEDIEECKVTHGANWKELTYQDIMQSEFDVLMGVSKNGDIPVAIGGAWQVPNEEKGVAIVWMLSTDEIVNYKFCLLRELKKEFQKYDEKYWFLFNMIYHKNYIAKNWLKWLGFRFDNPKPKGIVIPDGFEFFYRVKLKN